MTNVVAALRRILMKARHSMGKTGSGGVVAIVALFTLIAIVGMGIFVLPSGSDVDKSQNVVSIVTASFGVIGAIVGAYFGISSANEARKDAEERAADGRDGKSGDPLAP